MKSRFRQTALLALMQLLWSVSVLANGYEGAQAQVIRAEALFSTQHAKEALAVLRHALKTQRTRKGEHGYARYIHFRMARHHLAQGKRARAKQELKLALAITRGQLFVHQDFLVHHRHPFIMENFPKLVRPRQRKQKGRFMPGIHYVYPGPGPFDYVLSPYKLIQVNRAEQNQATIYEVEKVDSIYRYAVDPTHNRFAVLLENNENIQVLSLQPYSFRRIPKPDLQDWTTRRNILAHSLHFEPGGAHLLLFANVKPSGIRIYRCSTDPSHHCCRLLDLQGEFLITGPERLVYVTHAGQTRDRYMAARFQDVVARDLKTGMTSVLFTFPKIDRYNTVKAVTAGKHTILRIRDQVRQRRFLVSHDGLQRPRQEEFPYETYAVSMTPSFKEDYLILMSRDRQGVNFHRIDPKTAIMHPWHSLPTPPSRKGTRGRFNGYGSMQDNRSIWVHWNDHLYIVDASGNVARTDLQPLSRKTSPEWAEYTSYATNPERFYVGIEQGGGRTFMVVDGAEVKRP